MAGKRRGHDEGSIYQRDDGRWVAVVNLGHVNGKRKRKTMYARTRKEAAIKLQTALAAKQTGSLTVGRVTVETWLNYWLDVVCIERGLKVNTLKSHRSKVEQYLIPHLGRLPLDRLGPEHIRAMYAALRKDRGLSEATLRQTHAVLRRALEIAVRERKVPYNAATLIDPPRAESIPRKGLSVADARKVLTAAGDDPRWWLALLLGMRQGEALALRWSNVNLEEGWLFIEHSLAAKPGGGVVFEKPKTKQSARVLPLLPAVRSRLTVLWAQHLAAGGAPDGLVFSRGGQPLGHKQDWKAWSTLLEEAGVAHVPLHAARNTSATLLRAYGASDRDVADILGHSTVEMTRHYQGDDLERKREAIAALEAALSED